MSSHEDEIEAIYARVQATAAALMTGEQAVRPMAVAGAFAAVALQIYKTALTNEDYNNVIDSISEYRDDVKAFEPFIELIGSEDNTVH